MTDSPDPTSTVSTVLWRVEAPIPNTDGHTVSLSVRAVDGGRYFVEVPDALRKRVRDEAFEQAVGVFPQTEAGALAFAGAVANIYAEYLAAEDEAMRTALDELLAALLPEQRGRLAPVAENPSEPLATGTSSRARPKLSDPPDTLSASTDTHE